MWTFRLLARISNVSAVGDILLLAILLIVDLDIPLHNISSIEDGRQGLSKTIIINTKDGERYNFIMTNREEWKIKIQSAIESANC